MSIIDGQIPGFLMTSEPGSFARKTIVERKPEIIKRVIADNTYPPDISTELLSFSQEISSKIIEQ